MLLKYFGGLLLQQNIHEVVCSGQLLVSMTYPTITSEIITSYIKNLTQSGEMQYTIHVRKSYHYESDVKIVANSREVDKKNLHFSKCILQLCS